METETKVETSQEQNSSKVVLVNQHKDEHKNLAKKDYSSYLTNFTKEEMIAAENFLTRIIKSKKGGIETINDGFAILMRAKDLNLPFSTCIEHIHVINGKTGIDVHVIKALLLRAACVWKCTKDYQALYEYTDGINVFVDGKLPEYCVRCNNKKEALDKAKDDKDNNFMYVYPVTYYKDFNGKVYKEYQLNANYKLVRSKEEVTAAKAENKVPIYRIPNVPVDYITEYEFTRYINGDVIHSVGRFTYSEASQADLFEKDTYKKYPRILISHRAFTFGARDIADDVLFGVYEMTELKIMNNIKLDDKDIIPVEDAEIIE